MLVLKCMSFVQGLSKYVLVFRSRFLKVYVINLCL